MNLREAADEINLSHTKKTLLLVAMTIIFFFITIMVTGKIIVVYQEAMETRQQITDMESFISDWNNKVMFLNKEPYRAIKKEQLDDVQANIILALQANRLDLISFKNIKDNSKKTTGNIYEIEFRGTWESTARIIENFHVKDALISLLQVKMEPDKGGVKTVLQYKIYIK